MPKCSLLPSANRGVHLSTASCNGLFISKPIPCTAETYTVNVQINKIVLLTASPTEKESESKRIIVEERYD